MVYEALKKGGIFHMADLTHGMAWDNYLVTFDGLQMGKDCVQPEDEHFLVDGKKDSIFYICRDGYVTEVCRFTEKNADALEKLIREDTDNGREDESESSFHVLLPRRKYLFED